MSKKGRPSIFIKQMTYRDNALLAELSRVGMASAEQAHRFCQINHARLLRLENSKYLELKNITVRGQNIEVIRLGTQGREFSRQNFGTTHFPISQLNHAEHDIKLAEMYFSLPAQVQETWKHEQLIVRDIHEHDPERRGKLKTCVDAKVTIASHMRKQLIESPYFREFEQVAPQEENLTDIEIAIEAIGSSYTDALMDMKAEVAVSCGCSGMYSF